MGEKSKVNSDKRLAGFLPPRKCAGTGRFFSSVILREGGVSSLDSRFRGNDEKRRGNAMIYILLAIALLGGLTMTMMRGNETGGDDLSQDEAELLATQVIAYAATTKQAVDQMIMSGTPVNSLNFILPNDPAFNTGSNIHKVFHPAGGGLNYKKADAKIFSNGQAPPAVGWYIEKFNNVEWTPTTENDVILTAYGISKKVCEAVNKKLLGSNTILPFATANMRTSLISASLHPMGQTSFTAANCPTCAEKPSACTIATDGTTHAFYSIIVAQ